MKFSDNETRKTGSVLEESGKEERVRVAGLS
jgi:hypothetical protein